MSWVMEELSSINLGDKRLNSRTQIVCESFYQRPQSPINEACQSWKDTKAAYRLFENEKVTAAKLLTPHREATAERVKSYKTVLAIQDTTFFNFSQHKSKRGMGNIESKRRSNVKGILAHNTLITTTEGVPLGLFDQEIFARTGNKYEGKHWVVPIEQKEDYRWVRAAETVVSYMPQGVRVVNVCDREADIYEFLSSIQERKGDYLVRSNHNRVIGQKKKRWESGENTYLLDVIRGEKVKGTVKVELVDRKTKRKRLATLDIKFCEVELSAPARLCWSYKNQSTLKCYLVDVEEKQPPAGNEKIYWRLLTSVAVKTLDDAIERVFWYKQRWTIEVFHKVLKSGCNVENCRLSDFRRLQRCITLYSIVAWRLLWMTKASREQPNLPCTIAFAEDEWKILYAVTHQTKQPPTQVPMLGEAVKWMAQLGGFLARKSDGDPGIISTWRGWQQLNTMSSAYGVLTYG